MNVNDLDDPETYHRYLQTNLRVLSIGPLMQAPINDLDTLEIVNELCRLYREFQAGWLTLQPYCLLGRGDQ